MEVPFSPRSYSRGHGRPESRLVNLFAEKTAEGYVLLPRPGLAITYSPGTGPVRGIYTQPGVFSGAIFVVSDTNAYLSDGTSLGSVLGTDLVRWASSGSQLVIVAAGLAYVYEGTAFTQITTAALPLVSDVVFFGGRFVYSEQDSDRFHWSAIDDATVIEDLDFATGESSPDPIVGMAVMNDVMALFGSAGAEFWTVSSDPDAPFQRNEGDTYSKGCASRDAIVGLDNGLIFVGTDLLVYRTGNEAQAISTHTVSNMLRQCADLSACTAFGAVLEGHAFYVLNIAGVGTQVYDAETKEWAAWGSYGKAVFRGRCAATHDAVVLVGDDTTDSIYSLTYGAYYDATTDAIERVASLFIPHTGDPIRMESITLYGARGVGLATGQGSDPLVELRYSRDEGRTWSPWKAASLGVTGAYRKPPRWRGFRQMNAPGWHVEVRTTDPVLATFEKLAINERRPV